MRGSKLDASMILMSRNNRRTMLAVVYEIDGEHFVWVFEPDRKWAVRVAVTRMVINPHVYFTWHDAANVYQLINQAVAKSEMGL
jgi:hypothetical protein